MDYFILAVFVGTIAFVFGMTYGKFLMIKHMVSLLNEKELNELQTLMNKTEVKVDGMIIPILKQEVVGHNVYLYDDKGNFVCQGATSAAAAERYSEINPKTQALVDCGNDVHYTIVDGKIKK